MKLSRLLKIRVGLWGLFLVMVPLPFISLILLELPSQYQHSLLGIELGLVAYVWMLLSMYLSTRPHWLDRLIGLPEVYMMHGMIALIAILSAWLHKMLVHSGGLISLTGDFALVIFSGVLAYSIVMMAGWLTRQIPILQKLKKEISHYIKHEFSVWLHRLNVVGIMAIFLHVQLIGYISRLQGFMLLFNSVSIFVIGYYLYYKLVQPYFDKHATLIEKTTIAENVQELVFRVPDNYRWHPGDWVFIRFPKYRGLGEAHPFSIVNTMNDAHHLKLAIRGDGDFTKLLQRLNPAAQSIKVKLSQPFGQYHRFLRGHEPQAPLVIIAGGIGITPFMSILAAAIQQQRQVTFLYSSKRQQDALYLDELSTVPSDDVHFIYQVGRFKSNQVASVMQHDALYLLAGPHGMTSYWQTFLQDEGVSTANIYYEPFDW